MMKRILVVEDQEDLRGVLRTLLTGFGYEILEAEVWWVRLTALS